MFPSLSCYKTVRSATLVSPCRAVLLTANDAILVHLFHVCSSQLWGKKWFQQRIRGVLFACHRLLPHRPILLRSLPHFTPNAAIWTPPVVQEELKEWSTWSDCTSISGLILRSFAPALMEIARRAHTVSGLPRNLGRYRGDSASV